MNANEPAFPCRSINNQYPAGLTKREYFAAMAMQGLASDNATITRCADVATLRNKDVSNWVTEIAIEMADALLAELERSAEK